ncbi:hypothetical protein [Rhodopseudomonas palustris]|uniref:hypothetical protein n=1 Tax=Rhodopseudomonas palustris TaxID=1076 RepID=UPI000E5AD24F|nr:hypothetical protein [Rhodopseudomonas palustris]QLH72965.1 hypothetical protein HZF03_20020 [Rhodopseudomonas palustris]RHZ92116.1 hypothetical protein D1920_22215 [Rhodopseudomonas palustris]
MTDEAFALSPISARPVMPSDADYDAIREAFMETSRGRWFLTEYAKRNRNADTSMVLDAVARIEQTLAAQKQAQAEAAVESLAAIRAVIGEARASVAKAIATLDDTATLVAAHRGARAISEVASTLRECGADSRICDLLDQQVAAIDSGHRLVAGIDRDAIDAAFDRMLQHVAAISGAAPEAAASPATPETVAAAAPATAPVVDEPAPPQACAEPEAVAPQPAAPEPVAPQAVASQAVAPEVAEPAPAQQAQTAPALVVVKGAPSEEFEFVEAEDQTPAPAAVAAAPAEAPAAVSAAEQSDAAHLLDEVVALDAEGLEDDAVLDLVAREMSAPEVSAPYRPEDDAYAAAAASTAAEIESDIAALQQALSEEIAVSPEPMAIDDTPASAAEAFDAEPEPEPAFDPVGEIGEAAPVVAMAEPIAIHAAAAQAAMAMAAVPGEAVAAAPASLGAAAIANGAVAAPPPMRSDALVPIRRMSQAEKVAFFS